MHKDFYASGFLYHPPTYQILLQQPTPLFPASSAWSLFGGKYLEEEGPEELLRNTISELLDIETGVMHHVYTYDNENADKNQYVGYFKVRSIQNFSPKNGMSFGWFSFQAIAKMQMPPQMKHDIVVGERVIEAALRKHRGQFTLQ